ncbi:MAG: 2-C-methyl-D-erythritol 2,4-cyclodiphosphate synthase [Oscillospiraceae bacterium]|nr:2-C-methyl-D-erythritol 2,4-cyclodiphosphate synthase [Oscillospiraceae bacterium]
MRIGHGYDVHRLINDPARRLVMGGIEIPSELALEGHSDADVLTHAVMDALLGALALGDIGKLFPDSDDRYLGISSMLLLEKVVELVREAGASVSNLDATVVAQRPRLAGYIDDMRASLASGLGVDVSRVSVKATTEEKLGFTGRGEGIAAHAVVLLNE